MLFIIFNENFWKKGLKMDFILNFNNFTPKITAMKRILLLILFLNCVLLPAQNRIAQQVSQLQKRGADFKPFTVLQTKDNSQDAQVSQVVNDATLATVDLSKVNDIAQNQYEALKLQIPYQGQNIEVLLYKVTLLQKILVWIPIRRKTCFTKRRLLPRDCKWRCTFGGFF